MSNATSLTLSPRDALIKARTYLDDPDRYTDRAMYMPDPVNKWDAAKASLQGAISIAVGSRANPANNAAYHDALALLPQPLPTKYQDVIAALDKAIQS